MDRAPAVIFSSYVMDQLSLFTYGKVVTFVKVHIIRILKPIVVYLSLERLMKFVTKQQDSDVGVVVSLYIQIFCVYLIILVLIQTLGSLFLLLKTLLAVLMRVGSTLLKTDWQLNLNVCLIGQVCHQVVMVPLK